MSVLTRLKRLGQLRMPDFNMKVTDWLLSTWGNALAGETGELCNVIKKIERDGMTPRLSEHFKEEVGDVVGYLELLCQRQGVNLEDCIIDKFNLTSREKGSEIMYERTEFEGAQTLILGRSDLMHGYRNIPFEDISYNHFKCQRPPYKLVNHASMVIFIDMEHSGNNTKILKNRWGNSGNVK